MAVLTKTIKEQLAKEVIKPLKEEHERLSKVVFEDAEKVITNDTDPEVLRFFALHPNHVITSNIFFVSTSDIYKDISIREIIVYRPIKRVPLPNNQNLLRFSYLVENRLINMDLFEDCYKKALEVKATYNETIGVLDALNTTTALKKELPELYKLLPEGYGEKPSKNLPTKHLNKVKSLLSKKE